MNSTIYKVGFIAGLSALTIGMTIALTAITAQAQSDKTTAKKPARVTQITKDQFQLTFSSVPYTANASDAYVRNACKIAKNKKKPNS